ncbi:hypothetical protein L6E12_31210 [Actinokineospora sp. PR83]|uniref:hypothetical protein n=1 Tax=Actinokineospora sp. PR83 TaxID=2884908 RepID=UPI001F159E74|nr:hypothetical protein [Actinokineospora sp. PR83]MCG8920248.1 hypothetical protein [Actinokineospora sp. PR83]
MPTRRALAACAVTAGILGGATALAAAAPPAAAADVPWALVARTTAECLGTPTTELPALPGLAAIEVPRDLPRLQDPGSGTCFAEAAAAATNPIKALVDQATGPAGARAAAPTALIGELLSDPCAGTRAKSGIKAVTALVDVGVKDTAVLPTPEKVDCVRNSAEPAAEPLRNLITNGAGQLSPAPTSTAASSAPSSSGTSSARPTSSAPTGSSAPAAP